MQENKTEQCHSLMRSKQTLEFMYIFPKNLFSLSKRMNCHIVYTNSLRVKTIFHDIVVHALNYNTMHSSETFLLYILHLDLCYFHPVIRERIYYCIKCTLRFSSHKSNNFSANGMSVKRE